MFRRFVTVALVGLIAAACGGNSSSPTGPTSSTTTVTGNWTGIPSDSTSSTLGSGGMMGQAAMGTMTWQLAQNGSSVSGTVSFSGMPSTMMHGTVTGSMFGQDMEFTMTMPAGSMMSGGCSAQSTGIVHMNPGMSTMVGTYTGSNSCAGAFNNGQMTMTKH